VVQALPTMIVVLMLVGTGLWGHKHGWRAPRFADLWGSQLPAETEDWCATHNVPDSRCIKCHPELLGASSADWCKEHGVPESRCTICHPEILTKGVAADWCKEHGVPESSCTICHPEIVVKGKLPENADGVQVTAPENAPKDPSTCQTHGLRVQFASAESLRKAGVELGQAIERPMKQVFSANAETRYDRTQYAKVASRVPGVVWRVDTKLGQSVAKGEVLGWVESADIGRMKAELLTGLAQENLRLQSLRRSEKLLPQKISSEAEVQERQASLREAQIQVFNARQALGNVGLTLPETLDVTADERELRLMGLPDELRAELGDDASSANLIPIISPLAGMIVEINRVAGEMVDPSAPLFAIANISQMWLHIDLPQTDAGRVETGQAVCFRPDRSDDVVCGEIAWMGTAIDDRTRTVQVRANLPNAKGKLLANTFGRAFITVREAPNAVVAPSAAIQWEGCCHIVFVRLADDIFQTRKVRLGTQDSHYTEILVGLAPGEVIATEGSHVLKSEILKSNLGAGCCAVE
jgi:cobalt-zinc-cadmium efflux system membrane fusion protein